MTLDPGLSIAKIYTSVIYEDLLKASVFVPGRSFQPCIRNDIFVNSVKT